MRHAGDASLDELDGLLESLRATNALREKGRGVFYRGQKAFLHFHEDPSGLFADVRTDPSAEFQRMRVSTKAERASLLAIVRRVLRTP
jgi:hypothetical protein